MAILFAYSFFSVSVPLFLPQNPSLLRCACLHNALAPTVSLEGFFSLLSSSSPIYGYIKINAILRIILGLLKVCNNVVQLGQITS